VLEADGGFWAEALNGEASQAAYAVWGSDGTIGAPVAAAGGSGGFEFPSVEEMNAVLGMWKDRQASILQKKNKIDQIQRSLNQLAGDDASQSYLEQARSSLELLRNQHDSMLTYVDNYVQKLTDATNAKHANEDETRAAFTQTSETQ
jgi:hypothetical protein